MKRILLSLIAFAGVWMTAGAQVDLTSMPVPDWKNDVTPTAGGADPFYLCSVQTKHFLAHTNNKVVDAENATAFNYLSNKKLTTEGVASDGTKVKYWVKTTTRNVTFETSEPDNTQGPHRFEWDGSYYHLGLSATILSADYWIRNQNNYNLDAPYVFMSDTRTSSKWYCISVNQYNNHIAYQAYYDVAKTAFATNNVPEASKAWRDKYLVYNNYLTFKNNISENDYTGEINSLKELVDAWNAHPENFALFKEGETYDKSGLANNLTHVAVLRTIKAGTWNTLCLPFDKEIPAGWEVKELTGVTYENGAYDARFSPISGDIVAGKPYIVKVEEAVSEIGNEKPEGFTLCDAPGSVTVTETAGHSLTFTGVFAPQNLANCYFISGGKFYFAPAGNGNTTKAYRAIFTTDQQAQGAALGYSFTEDDVTGINFVNENEYENETLYNIAGQRVNANAKGIVIKNGKKYLVK